MANDGDPKVPVQATDSTPQIEPAPATPAEPDPTLPAETLPAERPGTEESVRAEIEGVSRYSGYAEIDKLNRANRIKNQGVRFALPQHTLQPPPVIRLRPLTHGMLSVAQGEERKRIRIALQIRGQGELPTIGRMELHRRLILRSLLEWCEGESDVEGAVRANEIKNQGVRYRFPRTMLPGVVLRLRPLSHFYVLLARAEAENRLRKGLGLKDGDDLPPEANLELQRSMIEASILEWCEGDVMLGGERFNLVGADRWEVRRWFREQFLPPPNLRDKPPRDDAEREEFFETMFEGLNNDFLEELGDGLDQIRRADPWKILAGGPAFAVGADWDVEPTGSYEPRELTSWASCEPMELRRRFEEAFFPPIDLKQKAPPGREAELFWEERFNPFHNDLLNELLEGQELIKSADPEDLLEKGKDFTVGALAGTASSA